MTPPVPRTARAARLLAALLVPLVALPALTGLVVCASDVGVTTSWGERPCPKKRSATGVALAAPDKASAVCVVVPELHDAPMASAPDLRAPTPLSLPAPIVAHARPAAAPLALLDGPRGPPPGALGALRTIVLRV